MADSYKEASLQKLKVAQLKKLLEEKGLPSGGNKPELISRLLNFNAKGKKSKQEKWKNCLLNDSSDKDIPEDDGLLDDTTHVADDSVNDHDNHVDSSVKMQLPAPSKIEANPSSPDAAVASKAQPASKNKLETRLQRFGVVSEVARKAARSERFQTAASSSNSTLTKSAINGDAIKKRAERFGLINAVPEKSVKVSGASDGDAIKKRSERFGLINAAPVKPEDVVPGVEQLKKRAERFGQVTSSSLTKVELQDRLLKRKQRFDGKSGSASNAATSADIDLVDPKKRRLQRFGAVSA